MKVIVTGAGALLGQGIIRSLRSSALEDLHIIAVDPSPLAAGLYWTDERYLVPAAASPDYIRKIETLLERTAADILIPGTDVELPVLSGNKALLEAANKTKILISSPAVIEIADDKYKTFEFFKNHGFAAPLSCLPGGEERLLEQVGFPLIVKPRRGARSIGVSRVLNREQLASAIAATADPVIQEAIGDENCEYTAGTVLFGEECAAIVMRRELRDGNTYRAEVDTNPQLKTQVESFARALKACGPANFQFRTVNGVARVFEINARFSGTTPLRMRAGFNEVEMCVRHLLDGAPLTQPEVKGITALRHWEETIVDLKTPRPNEIY